MFALNTIAATAGTPRKQHKRLRHSKGFIFRVVFSLVQFGAIYQWHQQHHRYDAVVCNDALPSLLDQQPAIPTHRRKPDSAKLTIPTVYNNVDYDAVARLQRPFHPWNRTFPCFPAEHNWNDLVQIRQPTDRGFLYFKARKAGSSTVAGVALRIARNMAQRLKVDTPHCHTRYGHPPAHLLKYFQRDKSNSFLWSIIREPTKRHVSEFFHFPVSRWKLEPTAQNFKAYVHWTPDIHNYYLQFMSTKEQFAGTSVHEMTQAVASIMDEYNFIGITERMHESLVCLQMILNLTISDILYLSAKQNGGFDDGLSGGRCYYIMPTYISPSIKKHLESDVWKQYTKGDNLLYATVNRSLDLTIDALGRKQFQIKLQQYQAALQFAQSKCNNVTFPCSPGGVLNDKHDCYLWDSGCGYTCLDQVAKDLGLE